MKREELKSFVGRRVLGRGTVSRFGLSKIGSQRAVTACLENVIIEDGSDQVFVDHVWFRINSQSVRKPLRTHSVISFSCRVFPYYFFPDYSVIQGYCVRKIREISVLEQGEGERLQDFIQSMIDREVLLQEHLLSANKESEEMV